MKVIDKIVSTLASTEGRTISHLFPGRPVRCPRLTVFEIIAFEVEKLTSKKIDLREGRGGKEGQERLRGRKLGNEGFVPGCNLGMTLSKFF